MGQKLFVLFVVGIILGVLVPFEATEYIELFSESEDVSSRVLQTYRRQYPDVDFDVLNIEEQSGLYKLILSVGDESYQTVYVTEDGKKMSIEMVDINEVNRRLDSHEEFIDCLKNNEVLFFGAIGSEDEEIAQLSILQLRSLSITENTEELYIDCTNNKEDCEELGVEYLPSMMFGEEIVQGLVTEELIEEEIGCTLEY